MIRLVSPLNWPDRVVAGWDTLDSLFETLAAGQMERTHPFGLTFSVVTDLTRPVLGKTYQGALVQVGVSQPPERSRADSSPKQ